MTVDGETRRIRKLEQHVVDKIAAGEVVHRPASALKELLENALDAGATSINVILKKGGLEQLVIQDNGKGIHREDMPLLCERYATSKITSFEDLKGVTSFGFRGEALSSISHISHMTVLTKTASDKCGYKGTFSDGKMNEVEPEACASIVGTQIKVDDLFYNMSVRKKYLSNANAEYAKCLEVMNRYAIHYPSISFMLRKQTQSRSDLNTKPVESSLDTIKTVFGTRIARELVELKWNSKNMEQVPAALTISVEGYISNASFSIKSFVFILFINHRLVNSDRLKRAVQQFYSTMLPKQSYPFVYLSISVPPHALDVNVHPTKLSVHFLHEVEICNAMVQAIEERLSTSNESRTFYTQAQLNIRSPLQFAKIDSQLSVSPASENSPAVTNRPSNLVRKDFNEPSGTLKAYFEHPERSVLSQSNKRRKSNQSKVQVALSSIRNLRAQVDANRDEELSVLFRKHVFCGVIDDDTILIQFETFLYICKLRQCTNALVYEKVLNQFGHFDTALLSKALSVKDLLLMSLEAPESEWEESDGDKLKIASYLTGILTEKKEMLQEYFGITIDSKGDLTALPNVIDGFELPVLRLPMFLLRLATEVEWASEEPCLGGIAQEIANLYQIFPPVFYKLENAPSRAWWLQFVLSPLLREFTPSHSLRSDIIQVASLNRLYKIFERC